jgi:hypothetical protein
MLEPSKEAIRIPAREGVSLELRKGSRVSVIDLAGHQGGRLYGDHAWRRGVLYAYYARKKPACFQRSDRRFMPMTMKRF